MDAGSGDVSQIIASEENNFDSTKAYSAGDVVVKDGVLYQFTDDHAAGEWNASDVEETNILTLLDTSGGVSGNRVINITYAELKALRDAGNLISGAYYRITDYHFTSSVADIQDANHPFDLIVHAVGQDTLSEEASACVHDGDTYFTGAEADLAKWKILYCLENDASRFAWADTENGKGVIYRMIDEHENEAPYDFKNAYFYQIYLPSNATVSLNGAETVSQFSGYTFSFVAADGTVYDASLHPSIAFDAYSEGHYRCVVYNNKIYNTSYAWDDDVDYGIAPEDKKEHRNIPYVYYIIRTRDIEFNEWSVSSIANNTIRNSSNICIIGSAYGVLVDKSYNCFLPSGATIVSCSNCAITGSSYSVSLEECSGIRGYGNFNLCGCNGLTLNGGSISASFSNSCTLGSGTYTLSGCDNITTGNNSDNIVMNYAKNIIIGTSSSALCNYVSNLIINPGCAYLYITCADTVARANNKMQNITISPGVAGSNSSWLTVTIPDRNLSYDTYVGRNSSGVVKVYNPADLVTA